MKGYGAGRGVVARVNGGVAQVASALFNQVLEHSHWERDQYKDITVERIYILV